MTPRPETIMLLSDAHGVNLPKMFAMLWPTEERARRISGVEPEDWAILEAGDVDEMYWDVWLGVCESAIVTADNGVQYTLSQDGDLWLIPVGMEWDDEAEGYRWPYSNVVPFRRKEQGA